MKDLSGKRILVIGATGGLGQIICKKLSEEGADLFIHGNKNDKKLEDLSKKLKNVSGSLLADITNEDQVKKLYEKVAKLWGGFDGLIITAGINPTVSEIKDISLSDWNKAISVNLTGPFLCVKNAIPLMKRSDGGKIVLVSSVFGVQAPTNRGAYSAAKHGLTGLVQTVSKEEGKPPAVISINAVCPGPFWGKHVEEIFAKNAKEKGISVEEYTASRYAKIPEGRFLEHEELANIISFLCSEQSNYINGEVIKVTGGAIE